MAVDHEIKASSSSSSFSSAFPKEAPATPLYMRPIEFLSISLTMLFWLTYATLTFLVAVVLYPVLFLIGGKRLSHKIAVELADIYWGHLIRYLEYWANWKLTIYGDKLPLRESAIVIVNHRWLLDWVTILSLASRKGRLGCCKFFAKNSVKWIPGLGWGIWLLDFIFLSRNWSEDHESIERTFQDLKTIKLPFWLMSHLEGTRFAPAKLKLSQDFAKKKDLPVLQNVLLPRLKGFTATVHALRDAVPAIYDLTIMYNKGKTKPTLTSIAMGTGGEVDIYVRRYPISEVPVDEEELSRWLYERWIEKDHIISQYLEKGEFPNKIKEPFNHLPLLLE